MWISRDSGKTTETAHVYFAGIFKQWETLTRNQGAGAARSVRWCGRPSAGAEPNVGLREPRR